MESTYCYRPIQTLCIVSTLGELRPVWFRYEDEEHRIIRANIREILSCEEKRLAGGKEIVYTCTVETDGIIALVELKYVINSHKWILSRKVT